jgi:CrcB protein
LQKYFLIAAGGALGSMARYFVGSQIAERSTSRFFYGTFVVNMSACLLIGFALTLLGKHVEMSPDWRYLIPVGFIGAYSTFSTFEWEMFTALETTAFLICALYVSLSVLLGLVAVWLGATIARAVG